VTQPNYELPSLFQQYIAVSKYSRWLDDEQRREIWPEPARRYVENVIRPVCEKAGVIKTEVDELCERAFKAIASAETLPSMRALMTAGPALDRDNAAGYNCSFICIDTPKAFDEILYLLACGCGVGFSVERQFINKLPEVPEELHDTDSTIVVRDSKIGWATALRQLISLLYAGQVPKIDVSKVRGAGERLKTFGGKASGPQPFVDLCEYTIRVFKGAVGRRLTSIEAHGIVCKIGEAIVVGGVRRSATLSLSNLTDQRMRNAKSGQWWESHPEYSLANNSVAYTEKPDVAIFLEEWHSLYQSKSGERGIFNRQAVQKKAKRLGKRDHEQIVGTNPCGEISLRNAGFCNLTEIVVRPHDTVDSLREKAELAAIMGTIQSTFTNFRYLRPIWKRNAEEERLLGVSMTGIYDHSVLNGSIALADDDPEGFLEEMKNCVIETNRIWAEKLGIVPSVATCTVKPAGTTSSLSNTASGIHPRHSEFYIRSVRQDNKDALTHLLKDQGVPWESCVTRPESTTVFYFPIKSPDDAVTRKNITALDHLNLWKTYNEHWSEHQVSVTVNVRESEWLDVAAWVYREFDNITGISFLPYDGGSYRQAPYQECTKDQYEAMLAKMPAQIDWSLLSNYERNDETTGVRELACVAGYCEI
jgi:ribonucleoside-triphosphate reductase